MLSTRSARALTALAVMASGCAAQPTRNVGDPEGGAGGSGGTSGSSGAAGRGPGGTVGSPMAPMGGAAGMAGRTGSGGTTGAAGRAGSGGAAGGPVDAGAIDGPGPDGGAAAPPGDAGVVSVPASCTGATLLKGPWVDTLLPAQTRIDPAVPAGMFLGYDPKAPTLGYTSAIFGGVKGNYFVYIPQQWDRKTPAPLLLLLDAAQFIAPGRCLVTTTVLDNLIHAGKIPPTIGIFVNPTGKNAAELTGTDDRTQRFLLEEIIPMVVAKHGVVLATDPKKRIIGGWKDGAYAAFKVAFQRPDLFSKVVMSNGEFIPVGTNPFPNLVTSTARKALWVSLFAQAADKENVPMAMALRAQGYPFLDLTTDDTSPTAGMAGGTCHFARLWPTILTCLLAP